MNAHRETAEDTAETAELDVTNVAHGGVSVARLEGRVVFVSDTLPGERVLARITERSKKSFWRAETVRVLDASPHRRAHVWEAASVDRDASDRAGGAEFGHIELAHQRELKRQVLVDALQRFGRMPEEAVDGLTVEAAPGDIEANGLGWRTRVSLHVDAEGRIGPYAARTHRVVPVRDLPLATDAVASIAPLDRRFDGAERIDLVAPSAGEARMIVRGPGSRDGATITERVGTREFALDEGGFWQVHRQAASVLTDAVRHAVDDTLFDPHAANLDLYGGVGLLAAALGDAFGPETRVTSVESSPRATDHAAENLAEWVGALAVTARVDAYLRTLERQAGSAERARLEAATVVLDPPRSGAGGEVVGLLAGLRPAQVVYVACDPVALARDIALFAEQGYSVRSLRAFDLFPHTHHVEAVALLTR